MRFWLLARERMLNSISKTNSDTETLCAARNAFPWNTCISLHPPVGGWTNFNRHKCHADNKPHDRLLQEEASHTEIRLSGEWHIACSTVDRVRRWLACSAATFSNRALPKEHPSVRQWASRKIIASASVVTRYIATSKGDAYFTSYFACSKCMQRATSTTKWGKVFISWLKSSLPMLMLSRLKSPEQTKHDTPCFIGCEEASCVWERPLLDSFSDRKISRKTNT